MSLRGIDAKERKAYRRFLESEATGQVAEIYADIRQVLGTSIVNLIWRNLATITGALEWTWNFRKAALFRARPCLCEAVRRAIDLPVVPSFSHDTLAAAGLSNDDVARIRDILDSYHYTNALALVVLSALVMHLNQPSRTRLRPRTVRRDRLEVKLPGIAADAITEA